MREETRVPGENPARSRVEIDRNSEALVTSRIDYCSGILYGLPDFEIIERQRERNKAAMLLSSSWFPVRSRTHFKLLTLTFKAPNGMARAYISDLISRKKARALIQALTKSSGDGSFRVAAPPLWNAPPASLHNIDSKDDISLLD